MGRRGKDGGERARARPDREITRAKLKGAFLIDKKRGCRFADDVGATDCAAMGN